MVPVDLCPEVLAALVPHVMERARVDAVKPSARCRALLADLYAAAQAGRCFPRETDFGDSATIEVSTADMAAEMGCSRQYVARLCTTGALSARKVGGHWLITTERKTWD